MKNLRTAISSILMCRKLYDRNYTMRFVSVIFFGIMKYNDFYQLIMQFAKTCRNVRKP